MTTVLSDTDKIILDRLLTEIAGRLDGAVDYWTLVCLGPLSPDPRSFLLKQCEIVHSLVVVVTAILAKAGLADLPPQHEALDNLLGSCQKLQQAFLILEQFRHVSLAEVHSATDTVGEVYTRIRDAIRQLGHQLEVPISYWLNRGPERDVYYEKILRGLFDLFCYERAAEPAVAALDRGSN